MIQRTVTITIQDIQDHLNTILPEIKITTEQHAANYNVARDQFMSLEPHTMELEEFANWMDQLQCLHRIANETFRKRLDVELGRQSAKHQPLLEKEKIVARRKKILTEAKKNIKTSKHAKREFLIQDLMDTEGLTEDEARTQLEQFRASLKK